VEAARDRAERYVSDDVDRVAADEAADNQADVVGGTLCGTDDGSAGLGPGDG
jgi:hypothetical protein